MPAEQRLRVLMAKPGLDGHWRGAMVVSIALRDAGMEVIYTGNQTPEEIAVTAIEEDVDVVGLNILSANHMQLLPEVVHRLREKGARNVPVVAGGTIPQQDIAQLKEAGIDRVFRPGTKLDVIVDYIREAGQQKVAG
jgi:methylmalonyl-CoA mutase C-terminal domain/subunit